MKLLKGLLQRLDEWCKKEEERRRKINAMPFWRGTWEVVKYSFFSYFEPLTKLWFWIYLFPMILGFSLVLAYYDTYMKGK